MEIDIRRAAQEDLDAAEQLYNDVCSALEAGTNCPAGGKAFTPPAPTPGAPRRPGRCTSPGTVPRHRKHGADTTPPRIMPRFPAGDRTRTGRTCC